MVNVLSERGRTAEPIPKNKFFTGSKPLKNRSGTVSGWSFFRLTFKKKEQSQQVAYAYLCAFE